MSVCLPSRASLVPASGGRSSAWFHSPGAAPVLVHLYAPTALSARTKLLVVMHGTLRNAHEYIEGWTEWAERTDHLVLAPMFDRAAWPGCKSYHLGNVLRGRGPGSRPTGEASWAFTVVEALHDRITSELTLDDSRLALWGHSAGGQFVHRFLLFKPRAPIRAAIAAGCGWFTVPDLATAFPYGLRHPRLGFDEEDARRYVRAPLTLVRGTLDTARDAHLRTGPAAEKQGRNRYERAGHMHGAAQRVDASTCWRLIDVAGLGHDWMGMAAATQGLLEEA